MTTQATLAAAEGSGTAPIKVDSEGRRSGQGIEDTLYRTGDFADHCQPRGGQRCRHHHDAGANGEANISGRTLGGGSGFGMLGAVVSQCSRYVGMAFGYYGLAWSVYSSVIARGGEVQFDENAVMDIKFGARTPPPASKFVLRTQGRNKSYRPASLKTRSLKSQ